MKLITKTSLNFISASVFFFFIGSIGGYYFIRYSMNKYLNNQLIESKKIIDTQIKQNVEKTKLTFADVNIDSINTNICFNTMYFKDTAITNLSNETDLYRQLCYYTEAGNQKYRIKIHHSTAPNDLQIVKFTFMLATFPLIFFLILFWVNRHSTKRSLNVFYDTIEKLKSFDVNKDNKLELIPSDVDEFEQLKEVFSTMDAKIKNDFIRLKEYTENTSHELQTPLSILSSKLDELLQDSNLTPNQIETIAGLIETTSRISRINQALIFLAKIDNKMFNQSDMVNVNQVITSILENFELLLVEKEIELIKHFDNEIIVNVNHNLLQTLLQNLIKNAILHNIHKGFINININNNHLIITNSGKPLEFEPNEAFIRYKNRGHHLSMGIGLSVVKRITEISNINIQYTNEGESHKITLTFNNIVH
ncbi:MAG: HAMP domain-containing histidine kinase [Marinilabiliaceae bacterium]|nr:HAMP domain-containing histidine kinase [Marinilabiliaceae bacterium]